MKKGKVWLFFHLNIFTSVLLFYLYFILCCFICLKQVTVESVTLYNTFTISQKNWLRTKIFFESKDMAKGAHLKAISNILSMCFSMVAMERWRRICFNPLRHSNVVGNKNHQTMSQIVRWSFDFWTNSHFPLAGQRWQRAADLWGGHCRYSIYLEHIFIY